MSQLKERLTATNAKLDAIKAARKAADKEHRAMHKQTRADRERKVRLVGEAVLQRLERGEWDEAAFTQMMDDALARGADRALFGLD